MRPALASGSRGGQGAVAPRGVRLQPEGSSCIRWSDRGSEHEGGSQQGGPGTAPGKPLLLLKRCGSMVAVTVEIVGQQAA